MPKVSKKKLSANIHAPLGQQLNDDDLSKKFAKSKQSTFDNSTNDVDSSDDVDAAYDREEIIDAKTSKKILSMANEQQDDIARSIMNMNGNTPSSKTSSSKKLKASLAHSMNDSDESDDDSVDSLNDSDNDDSNNVEFVESANGGYVSVSGPGLSESEEKIVAAMTPASQLERRTLADIIMEKIQQKEEGINDQRNNNSNNNSNDEDQAEEEELFPPKVIEVYTQIGAVLSRYTAGKLPKAFKVIPSLQNWEDVLYLTRPDKWTPQAMFAATRIFSSNLNPAMAQRFYNLILLDSVRADIVENKTLNYHYYMSLKKSLYKPSAFYKGVLLPLCKAGCTLREAAIVSSVLAKVSIPVHHSAVAIHKLGALPYSGAASVFIKTLLNKKYSLPVPVIQGLVAHFEKSSMVGSKEGGMPVLWHQAMLVFVERYKESISKEGKNVLKACCKRHFHGGITPMVRRELFGWSENENEKD